MTSRTYGNWGKPRSAGLYGMTFETTAILLGAIIIFLFTVMSGGLKAGIPLLIIEFLVVAPLVIKIGDETGYEKAIIMFKFLRAKFNGETSYRSGRFSRVPVVPTSFLVCYTVLTSTMFLLLVLETLPWATTSKKRFTLYGSAVSLVARRP